MNLVLSVFVTCVGVYVIFTTLGSPDGTKLGLSMLGLGVLILALHLATNRIVAAINANKPKPTQDEQGSSREH